MNSLSPQRNTSRMIQNLVVIMLTALLVQGCATAPIRPVDIALNPPTYITVVGNTNLSDRKVRIDDAEEIKRITKLITSIRGIATVSTLNFDPADIESLTITIHQATKSTELKMALGRMAVPDTEAPLFYESKNNEELWDLMVSYLQTE